MSQSLDALLAQLPKRYNAGGQKRLKALLQAIASGDDYIEDTIEAVRDNLLSPTASGAHLDRRASLYGVTRGNGTGIMDVDFRRLIPLLGMTPKQITTTINGLLDVVYGPYSTHANLQSALGEPFHLVDGDQLNFMLDSSPLSIAFNASDFVSISAATATEIATAITRKTGGRILGDIYADARTGAIYVTIRTSTIGPQGFLQVVGGNAQNRMRFPNVRPTALGTATWNITRGSADQMIYTLSAGVWPGLSAAGVERGDLVTIRTDSGLNSANCGTFPLAAFGTNYFVIKNGGGLPQSGAAQAHSDDICFYYPKLANVLIDSRPAASIETQARKLVIMMPVTSPVVKRTLKGGHHLHGGLAGVLAVTSNTAQLSNVNSFPAGGFIRPTQWRGSASGTVSSAVSTNVTLLNAQGWPTSGSFFSPTQRAFYQYSGVSGNVLTGVSPTPPSELAGQTIQFTPLWKFTGVSGATLTGVYPDPTPLLGLEVTSGGAQVIPGYQGGFLFDTGKNPGTIGFDSVHYTWHPALLSPPPDFITSNVSTYLTENILQGSNRTLVQMNDITQFPDTGSVVFEYGGRFQEGPVKFLGRSGSGGLILDPSYVFQMSHSKGVEVRLVRLVGVYTPRFEGEDYPTYSTSTSPTRALLQQYVRDIAAAGVSLSFDVSLPTYKWAIPVSLYSVDPNKTAL
jgi:hypothetical protein